MHDATKEIRGTFKHICVYCGRKGFKKRKVKKTYIYDKVEKYVIVLEQQRTNAFYLLTAYHLNREYGEKALLKKMKKRIATPL